MGRTLARLTLTLLVVSALAAPAAAGPRIHRPAGRATERARIVDFSFRPKRIEVDRRTRVRWVNAGGVAHTVTSASGLWDSGSVAPGETFGRVFRQAGTFRFRCSIHPSMTGRVVVT
jgi:plastocyanin